MFDFAKDAKEWGDGLNEASWAFIDHCPEKSALLFNTCKPALREAILVYAERMSLLQKMATPEVPLVKMLKDDITQLQQKNTEMEYTIEALKQRLIEAERNALYWTVFDCPVNRDIAERILRKEN